MEWSLYILADEGGPHEEDPSGCYPLGTGPQIIPIQQNYVILRQNNVFDVMQRLAIIRSHRKTLYNVIFLFTGESNKGCCIRTLHHNAHDSKVIYRLTDISRLSISSKQNTI